MDSNSTWGDWVQALSNEQPLLIAGPCSAETEAQVMATAYG
jgi:3-deoxy-D-arabino-heptulosonate 7-phosphate (DAHP) synthase